jgi:hypothetical protein
MCLENAPDVYLSVLEYAIYILLGIPILGVNYSP